VQETASRRSPLRARSPLGRDTSNCGRSSTDTERPTVECDGVLSKSIAIPVAARQRRSLSCSAQEPSRACFSLPETRGRTTGRSLVGSPETLVILTTCRRQQKRQRQSSNKTSRQKTLVPPGKGIQSRKSKGTRKDRNSFRNEAYSFPLASAHAGRKPARRRRLVRVLVLNR